MRPCDAAAVCCCAYCGRRMPRAADRHFVALGCRRGMPAVGFAVRRPPAAPGTGCAGRGRLRAGGAGCDSAAGTCQRHCAAAEPLYGLCGGCAGRARGGFIAAFTADIIKNLANCCAICYNIPETSGTYGGGTVRKNCLRKVRASQRHSNC